MANTSTLVALVTALGLAFGACTVKGPEVSVHPPVEVHSGPHGGKFCPPGQAKKGNC